VSLILLVIRELSINNPVIDLRVFKNVSFSSGTAITFITFFTMMSLFVLTPVYVQALLGYTATLAGMVMMPQGFCMMLSLGAAGMLCSKINPKTLLVLGMLGFAYSAKLMAGFNMTTDFRTVVLAMCFLGLTSGFIFVPLSILCVTGISNDKMGNATALWNLLRNIGGSVGISVVMTFISRGAQIHQQYLVDHMTMLDKGYRLMLERVTPLLDLNGYAGSAEGTIYGQLIRQAMMLSFVDVYNLLMFMMLAVIPLVIFIKNGKGKGMATFGH
jgi:DHA2 family multidrug resistance protein